jgi:hypothetical protein
MLTIVNHTRNNGNDSAVLGINMNPITVKTTFGKQITIYFKIC